MEDSSLSAMSLEDLKIAIKNDPQGVLKYFKDLESQNCLLMKQLDSMSKNVHSVAQVALSELLDRKSVV